MAQFTVYRNQNPDTLGTYPLLLDVQRGCEKTSE